MRIVDLHRRTYRPLILETETVSFNLSGNGDEDIVALAAETSYQYDFTVDWGDGIVESLTNSDIFLNLFFTHTYQTPGAYVVKIWKDFPYINAGGNQLISSIINIKQWGDVALSEVTFKGNKDIVSINATDTPNFINAVSLDSMFMDCWNFETVNPNIFKTAINCTSFSSTFYETKISSVDKDIFRNSPLVKYFDGVLGFTNLQSIPKDLFRHNVLAESFLAAFSHSNVSSVPLELFKYNPLANDFGLCFYTSDSPTITSEVPDLWNDFPNADGNSCFANQTLITNYNSIPSNWK